MRRSAPHLRHIAIEPLENRQLLSASLVPAFTGRLPATIAPSGVTHLNLKVSDLGTTSVAETMTLRIYASTDGSLDGSDVLLATVQKNIRLKPRAGASVPVNIPTPTNLLDGNYFLLAQVDGSSPVAAEKKQIAFQNPFSDVSVQFSQLPSQPVEIDGPSAGRRCVTAKIINTGNIAVRGKANLNYYLSADATLDSAADPLLATRLNQSVALKPHASQAVSFRVAIPPGTAVGAYFLFATITPTGGFTDANPANNVAVSSRRIAVVTQLPHPTTIQHRNYYYDNGTYIFYGFGDYTIDNGGGDYSTDYTDGSSDGSGDYSGGSSGDNSSSSAPDAGSSDSTDSSGGSDSSSSSDSWSEGDYVSSGGDF